MEILAVLSITTARGCGSAFCYRTLAGRLPESQNQGHLQLDPAQGLKIASHVHKRHSRLFQWLAY